MKILGERLVLEAGVAKNMTEGKMTKNLSKCIKLQKMLDYY